MEDKALITNATQLLSELNKNFQSCKQGTANDIRLQELQNTTLQELKKAEKLNNSILIDLEKFYQSTSLMIGLGSLKLNNQARTAWRNYDKFHYEQVKHVLTIYRPVFEFYSLEFPVFC
ncbi:helicase BlpT [Streptococcus mitis]|uniref:Helicase BlpT n=2 Tax=Streptococcus TaxID=1301 RepID=A0A2N6P6M3_STROR|nr:MULTISPECIES: helicase BlpT [Streptococcus]PKZ99261.1 helicase BlpT [Streptococcus mitis]PMB86342.1 helicase BlpT [Streptococcus oralis subsp. dentisani]